MLRVNYIKWNQTPQDLRDLSLYEEPPRIRERFLALYDIATGRCCINKIQRERMYYRLF